MVLQYDSIGYAMQKILRDIKVADTSLKSDLLGWVADALDLMNTTHQLIPHVKSLNVRNYGAELPCGVKSIQAVAHNGYRIDYGRNLGGHIEHISTRVPANYIKYWITKPVQIVPNEYHQIGVTYIQKAIESLEAVQQVGTYRDLYYYTQDNSIVTNLEEGQIEVYYLGVILDDLGYPMVPKNAYLLEAVSDYIDFRLTRKGLKEGNWLPLREIWEQSARRAINDIETPSPDQMRSLTQATLGLVKDDYYLDFV